MSLQCFGRDFILLQMTVQKVFAKPRCHSDFSSLQYLSAGSLRAKPSISFKSAAGYVPLNQKSPNPAVCLHSNKQGKNGHVCKSHYSLVKKRLSQETNVCNCHVSRINFLSERCVNFVLEMISLKPKDFKRVQNSTFRGKIKLVHFMFRRDTSA